MSDFRNQPFREDRPLVTIGILSYNYARFLEAALHSVLQQTYRPIELIVIDDGSADESPALIETWIACNQLDCRFIRHPLNRGITPTSNEIVQLARGKYLTLFATDDEMLPERIEKQVDRLEEAGEEYGMCYAICEYMNEEGIPIGRGSLEGTLQEGNVLEAYVNRTFGFTTPTSLIRRSVYDRVGLYDERVLIEDYNFFIRLVACYKVAYCDYPCIRYRIKKKVSAIFEKWEENHRERYYHDRILSNTAALRLIRSLPARSFLFAKINQYLKALAVHHSRYFWPLYRDQWKRGNFRVPVSLPGIYLLKGLRAKKNQPNR